MNKLKDTLLLLFWGIVAGAFFVGCILGFGYCINHIGPFLQKTGIPLPKEIFMLGLVGVIVGAITFISWLWAKTHKGYWKVADKIFSREMLFKIRSTPLACAILDGNDWKIIQIMGKNKTHWEALSNQKLSDGFTLLHLAVAVGNVSACDILLGFKANPLCIDDKGYTPFDYAMQNNNQAIIKLFEKYTKK